MSKQVEEQKPKPQKQRSFRVYVSQVNQTMVRVLARDANEARQKGYAEWRREYAHSNVCAVESDD